VAAVREYLIDGLRPDELRALRRIGTAVDEAISRSKLLTAPTGADECAG